VLRPPAPRSEPNSSLTAVEAGAAIGQLNIGQDQAGLAVSPADGVGMGCAPDEEPLWPRFLNQAFRGSMR